MLRTTTNPVTMQFSRGGGSIVLARVDVWLATPDGWKLMAVYDFRDSLLSRESSAQPLPPGSYTCVFTCFVQESLNGRYEFLLDVAGRSTFADHGDVNTTSAKDDSKVYKDQFVLQVTQAEAV